MSFFYLLLVLGSFIGNSYSLENGITLSDPICFFLAIIGFFNVISKKWHVDSFFKITIWYVPFMIFAALTNSTLLNTVFINFFRNYIYICIVYLTVINNINSIREIKIFCCLAFVYVAYFLATFTATLQDDIYDNLTQVDFEFGRNNVAFISLLLAIFCEFLYYSKLFGKYVLLFIAFFVVIMISCASRFAIIMLILSYLLYKLYSNTKFSFSEICTLFLIILSVPLLTKLSSIITSESFMDSSQEYLNHKLAHAIDDFYDTRIILINYNPISEFIERADIFQLFFGDGLSIQHSFVSHSFITTGIAGFLYYVGSMFSISKRAFVHKGAGMFLFVILISMIMNDFITNARFVVGVNSLLFGAITAAIYKYILLNEDSYISDRVC